MKVCVANVRCNPKMRQSFVVSDIALIAHLAGIWFGSEIEIPRYTAAWTSILRRVGAKTYNSKIECPISIKSRFWEVVDHPVTMLTHHGRRLTTPNRYLSILFTRRKRHGKPNPHGVQVCFIATHYVSGGWHKGFKAFKAWRRQMWAKHHDLHQQVIVDALGKGFNVVTGGDFNRLGDMRLHPDAVTIAVHGLDHLYAVPAPGYRVVIDGEPEIIGGHQVHTDHPILVGNFHFEPVAA